MLVCCYSNTVPNPCTEASAEIFVGRAGSYNAIEVGVASRDLMALNDSSCVGPYTHAAQGLRRERIGWDKSDSLEENFPSWFTIPRNLIYIYM